MGSSSSNRDAESQASIAAGGLPLNAVDRLREQASKQNTPQHFFTSDLSANEHLLTRERGFEPLGQVMGSCTYQVSSFAGANWAWHSGELRELTGAYYDARYRAMNRLQQEAKLLGAEGVVGVRLTQSAYEWGPGMLEFMAVGTAVRKVGAPPLTSEHLPFLSSLNGQDHYSLRYAGLRPTGFVLGNCSWFQFANWNTRSAMGGNFFSAWQNQELTDFTQATYDARELAMGRMEYESRNMHGIGVVGVSVESDYQLIEQNNTFGMLFHFLAMGTSIVRDLAQPQDLKNQFLLPLRG